MKGNVSFEEKLHIDIQKAFDVTMQWLRSQHKAKIKASQPPTFIEARQGTMMTNSGHDPNWKKKIRVSFYDLDGNQTLVRVEAVALARNIIRIEKLRRSWYDGLFSHLFSLLQSYAKPSQSGLISTTESFRTAGLKYCHNCGNKISEDMVICPACGIDIQKNN
ncbi:hypothetical protein LCGC14_1024640 [marine sediment metagenome]|uniref:Zinc-ribbon domain-containing protein n=1 Tax=marine sediment metagenome TaxID=412755 RepID=A0A0F9R285_9ZZZZ